MTTFVWIIGLGLLNPAEPVFHARGGDSSHTRCGRYVKRGPLVHLDHAVKFAHPCRMCWPPGHDR